MAISYAIFFFAEWRLDAEKICIFFDLKEELARVFNDGSGWMIDEAERGCCLECEAVLVSGMPLPRLKTTWGGLRPS